MTNLIASGMALFVFGGVIGFMVGTAGMKRRLEELQEEYATLCDRDPKTGRFVKSMRTLKRD
jgi:hypothetical protein